jgi:pyruvate dehydrogenase E1 component beta subunit
MIQKRAFDYLDAPVLRVNTADTPAAYSPPLIAEFLPSPEKVIKAVRSVLYKD